MAHLLSRLRTTHRVFSVSLTPSTSIVQSDLGFGKDCNCPLFMLTRDMFSIGTIGLIYLFSRRGYTEGKHRWGGVCWFERTARRSRTLSVGIKRRKSVLVFIQSRDSAGVGFLDPLYIRLPSTHVYISSLQFVISVSMPLQLPRRDITARHRRIRMRKAWPTWLKTSQIT